MTAATSTEPLFTTPYFAGILALDGHMARSLLWVITTSLPKRRFKTAP